MKDFIRTYRRRLIIFLGVFGPATIAAVADNDAAGVATYSIAGATLGYPILFVLLLITPLLALTQEMGIRLSLVTRKGFGDLIRERFGVKVSVFLFAALLVANMGTIIVNLAAVKTTSAIFNIPVVPAILALSIISFLFVTRGNYRLNQNIMLGASFFYIAYIFSAIAAKPDWSLAISNLFIPHGVPVTPEYLRNFLIIGLGVVGTTITPWGQFFVSSFAFDKKIEVDRLKYSQFETYFGAILTDFFSFFMIVATAATLFVHGIPLVSGDQAALAIRPFAGDLAGTLFAVGILNAGFMGVVIVALSTAYAFAEFFGLSGGLDSSFTKGRTFYLIFLFQLIAASLVVLLPSVSLFRMAIFTQTINAMILPIVLYYLLKLTNDPDIMGTYTNSVLKKRIAFGAIAIIALASAFVLIISLVDLF